ncbi:PadR family transcriptional regulator [Actinophytocola sp.]|jgi:DNA-binding PadR family transcriptional regulator|uniref:PadR family transcriptional regulator n=1 Tax=Actinophytocola sp. TaxID=1872138 RepID=UPI002ED84AFD
MSLRHALLALVEAGAMTGYELAKWFDQSVAYVWYAQHSQIYPELRRLEAEGLVVAETRPRGEKALATKRAYALTKAGAEELRRWVGEVEELPALRDPAYVKATYLEYASPREARAQFRAHRAHYEALRDHYELHVEQLERRATDLLRRRLARAPQDTHDAIVAYKAHAYRGLIDRAKTEIGWADRGLELVDRLAGRSGRADGDEPVLPPTPGEDAI